MFMASLCNIVKLMLCSSSVIVLQLYYGGRFMLLTDICLIVYFRCDSLCLLTITQILLFTSLYLCGMQYWHKNFCS